MLLYLYLLLAGCLCHSFPAPPVKVVLQNTEATLPCPHPEGDVTWSRYINGEKVTLVKVKNDHKSSMNERYRSLANYSLLIVNVKDTDSSMYDCNGKKIYLDVTTDPNMVVPNAELEGGNIPVTQINDRLGGFLGPGQKGKAAASDAEQQSSDIWKVPVGAVIGAALMLLAILTLRFCSKKRTGRNINVEKTVNEVIYEEIENDNMQQRRESDVECPYYWTSITEIPDTSTPPTDNLYATVNKLKTKGHGDEQCVYSLAQNPLK
ncbi:hypothetical protein PAMP_021569 [Pampus punctatissimus]